MLKASAAPNIVVTQALERCVEDVFTNLRNQFGRHLREISSHGIDRACQVRSVAIGIGQIK